MLCVVCEDDVVVCVYGIVLNCYKVIVFVVGGVVVGVSGGIVVYLYSYINY